MPPDAGDVPLQLVESALAPGDLLLLAQLLRPEAGHLLPQPRHGLLAHHLGPQRGEAVPEPLEPRGGALLQLAVPRRAAVELLHLARQHRALPLHLRQLACRSQA